MKKSILVGKNICKSFANNGVQNHVLDNVNLELFEGDFTVIMGSSGSGKSTLLYSLSGMDRITSGEVIYQGEDISNKSENELAILRRKDFGFIFQQMNLVSNLNLLENVTVPGFIVNKNRKEVVNRGEELLCQMGLEERMKNLPSQLSGGEQQRACIARAVINNPTLIFADEPTGALNKKTGVEVLNLLTELNQKGQTILMVTHDIKAAVRANRILYLEDGTIDGELNLPGYSPEKVRAIETQVSSWLLARGW